MSGVTRVSSAPPAHHQRRAKPLSGRIDAALEEERSAHPNGDVERRDEAQIQPVRAVKSDPLSERPTDCMRRDEHPLGARNVCPTEFRQLQHERGTIVIA